MIRDPGDCAPTCFRMRVGGNSQADTNPRSTAKHFRPYRTTRIHLADIGPPHAIDQWYSWAQLLPGGRDFLYTIDDPQRGSMRARIAPIAGTEPRAEVVQSDSRVQYTGSHRSKDGYLVYL